MEGGVRGLVIVLSAFMVQVLALGNYSVLGIYNTHLMGPFNGDAVGISFICSIHQAMLLGFGPVTSFLMGMFSARKLCLVGAALVCVGIFCTPLFVFLPSMYLFFGVFAGLGGCLIYLPSHVLSGLYYDKYRSLAVGAATAGQGFGATIMPLLVGLLIEEYTWRGSLVVLAGVDLHLFILALLMVPPPNQKTAERVRKHSELPEASRRHSDRDRGNGPGDDLASTRHDNCHAGRGEAPNGKLLFDKVDVRSQYQPARRNAAPSDNSQRALVSAHSTSEGDGSESGIPRPARRQRVSSSSSVMTPRLERRPSKRLSAYLEGKIHRRPIPDDDISNIFIPSYYSWLPGAQGGGAVVGAPIEEDYHHDHLSTSNDPHLPEEAVSLVSHEVEDDSVFFELETPARLQRCGRGHHSPVEELKKHLGILLNFQFLIYLVSTLLWSLTTNLFLAFSPDYFVSRGHTYKDAAFVMIFYGAGQFLGCIVVSVLGSLVGRRRMLLFVLANALTGVFMSLVPMFSSFTDIALILVCQGLFYGGILGLYMIVMVDILGTDNMDIGLGYTMFASGIGCFAGPPIGGAMFQAYGNYDMSFVMSGLVTVLAGLVMGVIYVPGRCRRQHRAERVQQS